MTTTYCTAAPWEAPNDKRAALAAGLSVIPGLGHVYCGQTRKGLLFLYVASINFSLVSISICSSSIASRLSSSAITSDTTLMPAIAEALNQFHFGSPASLLVVALFVFFAIWCGIDAFFQFKEKQRLLYFDADGHLSEALGASYIVHFALLSLFVALVAVLAQPLPETKPTTVYELVLQPSDEPNTKKTDFMSEHSAKDHGKRDLKHDISLSSPAPAKASALTIPKQAARQQAMQQQAIQQQIAQARTQEAQQPVARPVTKARKPQLQLSKNGRASQTKANPEQERRRRSLQRAQQAVRRLAAQRQAAQRMMPASAPDFRLNNTNSRPRFGQDTGRRLFNPSHFVDDRNASVAAAANPNFGPYMKQLQRRIKQNWKPQGQVAKKVRVTFKITSDGRLLSLRLDRSSGSASYDRAALDAVRSAAPFMPLPAGSPSLVDIEFVFDD